MKVYFKISFERVIGHVGKEMNLVNLLIKETLVLLKNYQYLPGYFKKKK